MPKLSITLYTIEEVISKRTGLLMRSGDSEHWQKVILERVRHLNLSSKEEYYYLLVEDSKRSRLEWRTLTGLLTTGETYFFRDKGQFALLRNWILPELIERKKSIRSLRLWSAGCSSGEETYSIAILLDELLPKKKDWEILILGTDINDKAIEKAKMGIYGQWSFRMVNPEIQRRYFQKRKDEWEIDARIREMVKFQVGNLREDPFPDYASDMHDMDIILCRNVFIYFNDEAVSITLQKIINTLSEKGYLITGHGELHAMKIRGLQPIIFPESVVYQKRSELGVRSFEFKKPEKHEKLEIKIKEPMPEIQKVSIQQPKAKEREILTLNAELQNLLDTAEYCADIGEYDEASLLCKKAIDIDATAVKPYFLLAHIVEAKGNIDEAKSLLKKVIYLDPVFIPAYLELGAIYDNENDSERAKKMRLTAIDLIGSLPPEVVIEPYRNITAEGLLRYVKKLIDSREK